MYHYDKKSQIKVEPHWNVNVFVAADWYPVFVIKVEPYWNYIDCYVKIII